MAVHCFTQIIQPGRREEAKAIFEEREERVWFQSLPDGEMAVVYWEGDDPRAALQEFALSDDPFYDWLKERGREVYHFEPGQTLEADEEIFDARVD